MTITKSITTSITSSITSSILGAITRYFSALDPVLMSHYVYTNTLVFGAGDTFEFEFLAPTGVVSGNQNFTDGDNGIDRAFSGIGGAGTFIFNAANTGTVTLDGVNIALDATYPTDGEIHRVLMSFIATCNIKFLGRRFTVASFYNGILANPVATISGVTTSNAIGLGPGDGNIEASITTGPANDLNYVAVADGNRELFQLSVDETQWDNISPPVQVLPAVIEIA